MAFSLSALSDPAAWLGVGGSGGIIGFVVGHIKVRDAKITRMEKEIEACRERDAHLIVLTACFRSLWGEQMRREPDNPVLKMCGDLLAAKLPVSPEEKKLDGFADLMSELNKLSPTGEVNHGKAA